ncbi:hypothetical protein [Chryseobacterium lathyri]|jgi:hypothetical protein|uniref:Uncharacterized protein n=1 Tax=Chryseobacterium lathyri TaxID=395933 RepID=A0ABT9SR94_9FLAO|nr:hypothetical protein [Chryseobacterium lathyri]MDP9961968.1 hypothetical protein [Chryseobacterium lathyri]
MNKIKLHIDKNSFRKYKETITGIIYLEINDFLFPEKNWNDLIIVMMNNWVKSLRDIKYKVSEHAELLFFDGPFFIKVKMLNEEDCIIEFFEDHRSKNILSTLQIKFEILVNEVFQIANLCSTLCKKQNWETEELNKLDILLQK